MYLWIFKTVQESSKRKRILSRKINFNTPNIKEKLNLKFKNLEVNIEWLSQKMFGKMIFMISLINKQNFHNKKQGKQQDYETWKIYQ